LRKPQNQLFSLFKSLDAQHHAGSNPVSGTKYIKALQGLVIARISLGVAESCYHLRYLLVSAGYFPSTL
jgi:hypothetical protein